MDQDRKVDKVVLYDSPEAASFVTVTGWMSRNGIFYGDDERTARWYGCTHIPCEQCKEPTRKGYSICDKCRGVEERERYEKLERRPWTEGPVAIYRDDHYFWDDDDILEYCEEEGINPDRLMLVLCKPCDLPVLDANDFLKDVLPEDQYCEDKGILEAAAAFNEAVKKATSIFWYPDKYAAVWRKDTSFSL